MKWRYVKFWNILITFNLNFVVHAHHAYDIYKDNKAWCLLPVTDICFHFTNHCRPADTTVFWLAAATRDLFLYKHFNHFTTEYYTKCKEKVKKAKICHTKALESDRKCLHHHDFFTFYLCKYQHFIFYFTFKHFRMLSLMMQLIIFLLLLQTPGGNTSAKNLITPLFDTKDHKFKMLFQNYYHKC